jgi:hypothetical protein
MVAAAFYAAPLTTRPLPYGLLSVADVVTDTSAHWRNGVIADGDACVVARYAGDPCDPPAAKEAISAYTVFEGEPFTVYALNSCKTVGRLDTAEESTRRALERSEGAAVEAAFWERVLLPYAVDLSPDGPVPLNVGVGMLEGYGAANYGGLGILHSPRSVTSILADVSNLQRNGSQIETFQGTPIASGGGYELSQTNVGEAWLWMTGTVRLTRSDIDVVPMTVDRETNDFFSLAERTYVAVVDCFVAGVRVQLPCCVDCA